MPCVRAEYPFRNAIASLLLTPLFGIPSGVYRLHHRVMHHVVSRERPLETHGPCLETQAIKEQRVASLAVRGTHLKQRSCRPSGRACRVGQQQKERVASFLVPALKYELDGLLRRRTTRRENLLFSPRISHLQSLTSGTIWRTFSCAFPPSTLYSVSSQAGNAYVLAKY